jgi:hypothetical protein
MELLDRAIAELSERNYGSAIRSLEMLTGTDPMNAEAWKHLARAYHGVGDRAKAADAAQRYAALRPGDAGGHYNAGVLLAQFGQREAAERAFRAALTADPGHAKARQALHKLTEEGLPEAPARPAAPARGGERRGTPWQGKVAAALTVVAALAILLWLFLTGGRARPGAPTQNPQPSPNPITTPSPDQPTANQPDNQMTPTPDQQPEVQPQPEGTAPLGSAQPSAGATVPNSTSRSPEAALQVLAPVEQASKAQMYQQVGLVIAFLRKPEFQDPENMQMLGAAIGTGGLDMLPGKPSFGHAEVIALVVQSETGNEAAAKLERQAPTIVATSWAAFATEAQGILVSAQSAQEAEGLLVPLLQKHGIALGQPDVARLRASVDSYYASPSPATAR